MAHAGRWGSVPEALLEDRRLSLDARAVAAWLAIKADGWQISVSALRQATAENRNRLSTHKWGRIAKELEVAGYLCRQRTRGEDGQWVWNIVFSPISKTPEKTIPEKTEHGFSAHGKTKSGKTADKHKPAKPSPSKPSPPQPSSGSGDLLIYPTLRAAERDALGELIATCPAVLRQPLLDEVQGAMAKNKIHSGVVPYARALVRAVAEGRFTASLGVSVTAARQAAATAANPPVAQFELDPAAMASGERLLKRIREKACV